MAPANNRNMAPANNRGESRFLRWLNGVLRAQRTMLVSGAFSTSAIILGRIEFSSGRVVA
eukprot:61772-Prorocentrum_minimum.AAC.1